MMFTVALTILVSICAVQSAGIYGDVNAVIPEERGYIQDLIDLPKPLDENMMVQRCSKQLSVALNYLCPPLRRSPEPGLGKTLLNIGAHVIGEAFIETLKYFLPGENTEAPKPANPPARYKRQLLTDECCDKSCTLGTLLQYCPH